VPAIVVFPALLVLALLAFACNEASEPSPEGAPTPVIGIYDDPQDFRSFAARLEEGLTATNAQFFLSNTKFEQIACNDEGFPAPPSSCVGLSEDHRVPAILISIHQSERYYLDAVEYEDFILEFITNVDAGATDDYGDAAPHLYALSVLRPQYRVPPTALDTAQAIVTRISGPQPETPLVPSGELERGVLVFNASFDGLRWDITGVTVGPAAYLDPTSSDAVKTGVEAILQFWQRWGGAAPEEDEGAES
jgi:hypothetical protein